MVKFDENDVKILSTLQEDAKTNYRKMAKDIDISIGSIHKRVKKYILNGIIQQIRAITNNKVLGFDICFLINMKMKKSNGNGNNVNLIQSLKENGHVQSIYRTTGDESYTMICYFSGIEEAKQFIDKLSQDDHIEEIVHNIIFDVIKDEPCINVGKISDFKFPKI